MGSAPKHGDAPASTISEAECHAMRALDRSDSYARREIAFMFECQVSTVARHADHDCPHASMLPDGTGVDEWGRGELATAYLAIYGRVPYQRLSSKVYDDVRPDTFPHSAAFIREYGSWVEARAAIRGDGDE